MNTEQLNIVINEYFDGELEKDKEQFLFSQLSLNAESREYFKSLSSIKNTIESTVDELPSNLEERILFSTIGKDKTSWSINFTKNVPAFFSYVTAVILLIISLIFYNKSVSFEENLELKTLQIKQQNHLINLLYNSLPASEVETKLENSVNISTNL